MVKNSASPQNINLTYLNKEGALCMVWAFIQQIVVAASTFFIVLAIRYATEKNLEHSIRYVLAFAISLFIVYFPNTVSLLYLQKWRLASFSKFIKFFIQSNSKRTTWSHARDKSKYESWITNESIAIYDSSTSLFYQLFSTFLSTLFNISVIAIVIDWRIFAWYLIAGLLLWAISNLSQNRIASASINMQESRKNLSSLMLSAWDNIFIGNRYTLTNWENRFEDKVRDSMMSAVSYDLTRSLVSSLAASLALLIIAIGNGIFYVENSSNMPEIAALFITFPRQIQTIQNIFLFFNMYLNWEGIRRQLQELGSMINIGSASKHITDFIQLENLNFFQCGTTKKYTNLQSLRTDIVENTQGRITVRGKNGSGKSTLLAYLAEGMGDDSFFLPSNYANLAFSDKEVIGHSDGNRLISVIHEILNSPNFSFVLLDEWDANLDSENIKLVNTWIDKIAISSVVIESRHRA